MTMLDLTQHPQPLKWYNKFELLPHTDQIIVFWTT